MTRRVVALAVWIGTMVCIVAVVNYFIADPGVRLAACALAGLVAGATIPGPVIDTVLDR